MIFDKVENLSRYFDKPWVSVVLDFYKTLDLNTPNGEYELMGRDLYCKVLDYETKTTDFITESHRKYVDIQISLIGVEIIEVYHENGNKFLETKTYEDSSDCAYYLYPAEEPHCRHFLTPEYMGIYFPSDIHTCQIAVNNSIVYIKKAVFKISKELIFNE
jgi:YhcH/YjgK/YiaL family protein